MLIAASTIEIVEKVLENFVPENFEKKFPLFSYTK